MRKIIIVLFYFVIIFKTAIAQDANYWSSSYNPAGFLTPGAVVAYNRDSGVLFLNPALLANNTKNTASISGSVYQYNKIKIKNGVGTGLDLTSKNTHIIPQIVSASLFFKGEHPFTVAYALIRNPIIDYQVTQQRDARFNVLDDSYSPGDEFFLGQFKRINKIDETAGILSAGYKASKQFSIGFSAEGQVRKQTFSSDFSSRALFNVTSKELLPPFTNVEESYLATYTHVGIRFKAGAAYDAGLNHVGITVSSPLLHVGGKAGILSDLVITDLNLDGDTISFLANARQVKLKSTFKMPLSIAFGYARDFKKGQIYFAAEYFNRIKDYNIIKPRDGNFIRGDVPLDVSSATALQFKDGRRAIMNVGLGASYQLRAGVTGFLSVSTDFNYADSSLYKNEDGYISNTANYNIYHSQAGVNIKKRNFNFRAGLLFAYGTTKKYAQFINFDNPNENNTLVGDPVKTRANYLSAGLLLSYIHNL